MKLTSRIFNSQIGVGILGVLCTIVGFFACFGLKSVISDSGDGSVVMGTIYLTAGIFALIAGIYFTYVSRSHICAFLTASVFFFVGGYLAYLVTYEGSNVFLQALAYALFMIGVKLCSFGPVGRATLILMCICCVLGIAYFCYGFYLDGTNVCGVTITLGFLSPILGGILLVIPDMTPNWGYTNKNILNKIFYVICSIIACVVIILPPIISFAGGVKPVNTNKYDDYDYSYSDNKYNDYNGDGEYGFSDYLKDQAPDLYDDIKDRYDSLR